MWWAWLPRARARGERGDAKRAGRRRVCTLHRADKRDRAELVGDCEAFLTGHLVDRIEDRAVDMPAWAWTNLLAHGSEQELSSEARQVRGRDEWRQARSYLAAAVLDVAAEFGPLLDLQRAVLVPFELELASSRQEIRPARWVADLQAALGRYRRERRRALESARQGSARTGRAEAMGQEGYARGDRPGGVRGRGRGGR